MPAMSIAMQIALQDRRDEDARRAALTYVGEAFALAALDGIGLADRASAGEFSVSRRQ